MQKVRTHDIVVRTFYFLDGRTTCCCSHGSGFCRGVTNRVFVLVKGRDQPWCLSGVRNEGAVPHHLQAFTQVFKQCLLQIHFSVLSFWIAVRQLV